VRPRVGIDARLAWATGIGRYVRGLVNALVQEERELTFVLLTNPRRDPTAVWDWLDAGEAKDEGRVEVLSFGKPVLPHTIAEQAWLPEVARSKKLDLMHVPNWNVGLATRCPVVTTFHDATYLRIEGAAPSRVKRWGAGFMMRRAARKSARVLVPSVAAGDEVVEWCGVERSRLVVTPLFTDEVASWVERVRRGSCETVSERVRALPRFVLYVGTHLPHKDLPGLIAAFARVKKDLGLRELVLAVAGPRGRGTPACEAAAKAAGVADNVVFLGEVTDRDLGYLYDRAACFATASRAEGFGLPSLEALAAGTPVIATDIPAHREVLGDAALLVPPGDEKALAGALARVLTIEALARDLSRRGMPRGLGFRAQATARATANAYRAVLGLTPAPAHSSQEARGKADSTGG
jgi:glycosyltransferase involved in cell wall biosynthesis